MPQQQNTPLRWANLTLVVVAGAWLMAASIPL